MNKIMKLGYLITGTVIGAIIGLSIWIYDYDFFLNVGGPYTPISDALVKLVFDFDSRQVGPYALVQPKPPPYIPLMIMIGIGSSLGAVIGFMYGLCNVRASPVFIKER